MFIVEVALQGVAGFPALVRLSLEPGVNVARTDQASVRRAMVDLVYHTLYPHPRRRDTRRWAAPGAKDSRVAVTFFGRDHVTYRLIREVRTGGVKLYRFETDRQKYRLFTQDVAEAAQFVRVQQQLPDEVSYERLFVYAPESMPSRGEGASTRSGHPLTVGTADVVPSGPGMPAGRFSSGAVVPPRMPPAPPPPRVHNVLGPAEASAAGPPGIRSALAEQQLEDDRANRGSAAEMREEIARLRARLEHVRNAEEVQGELDRVHRRRAELVEVVEAAGLLRSELEDLKRAVQEQSSLAELPDGFEAHLRGHEEREAWYRGEAVRIHQESRRLSEELEGAAVLPLGRDRYFVFGMVAAVLFVGAAIGLERPWMALLNVPAALIAAAAAFRYVADRENRFRVGLRVKAVEEHRDRIDQQHRSDTAAVQRMLRRFGVDSASALLERVKRYQKRRVSYEEAKARLERLMADGSVDQAEREVHRLEARAEALEALIVGVSSHESADAIERKIRKLKSRLEAMTPRRRPASTREFSKSGFAAISAEFAGDQEAGPPVLGKTSVPGLVMRSDDLPGSDLPAFPQPPPLTSTDPPPSREASARERSTVMGTPESSPRRAASRAPSRAPIDRSRSGVRVTPAAVDPEPTSEFSAFVIDRNPASIPEPPGLEPEDGTPAFASGTLPPSSKEAVESLFDFEGRILGEEDEEEGYGSGYGTARTSTGEPGSELRSPASPQEGWLAVSSEGGAGNFGDGGGPPPRGASWVDPADRSRELIESARDVLQLPVEKLAAKIETRMGQYLSALTRRRYNRVKITPRGAVQVGLRGSADLERYCDLSRQTLDEVDAAVRFCLAEAVLRQYHVPMLIDDPFLKLDAHRRKLLAQMLQYLGRATQIVVLTPFKGIEGHSLSW